MVNTVKDEKQLLTLAVLSQPAGTISFWGNGFVIGFSRTKRYQAYQQQGRARFKIRCPVEVTQ